MTVRFYYDIVCPYAYIASLKVEEMAARTRTSIEWCPVLLGGLFREHGTADVPANTYSPAKAAMGAADLLREAQAVSATFLPNPRHPQRSVTAMRLVTAAQGDARVGITKALYRAYWVDNCDINDPDILRPIAEAHGLSLEDAARPEVKAHLRENTATAAQRGVFGVPTFEVNGTLWWGQDRMHLVEQALGGNPIYLPAVQATSVGHIKFFHDFSSPYSYLAATQIRHLATAWGVRLEWRPILLGALFRSIGTANIPIFTFGEARRAYTLRDLTDWAKWWNVPFKFNPHFPMRTVTAGRVAILEPKTTPDIYKAAWVDGIDLNNDDALIEVLSQAGHDGHGLVTATQDPAIKAQLRGNTEAAASAGACGAPTVMVGSQIFWGQDRLNRVSEALML